MTQNPILLPQVKQLNAAYIVASNIPKKRPTSTPIKSPIPGSVEEKPKPKPVPKTSIKLEKQPISPKSNTPEEKKYKLESLKPEKQVSSKSNNTEEKKTKKDTPIDEWNIASKKIKDTEKKIKDTPIDVWNVASKKTKDTEKKIKDTEDKPPPQSKASRMDEEYPSLPPLSPNTIIGPVSVAYIGRGKPQTNVRNIVTGQHQNKTDEKTTPAKSKLTTEDFPGLPTHSPKAQTNPPAGRAARVIQWSPGPREPVGPMPSLPGIGGVGRGRGVQKSPVTTQNGKKGKK
jgi:hypothetical protein